jgi:hypothetical protein
MKSAVEVTGFKGVNKLFFGEKVNYYHVKSIS